MTHSITGNSLRADAARFFDWCNCNLRHHIEKITPSDKAGLKAEKMPENLVKAVCSDWSWHLKTHLPWNEHFGAVRKALPNQRDYEVFMNCPLGQQQELPSRIRSAVNKEVQRRLKEIQTAFFANAGEERLENYLRVWKSQSCALDKLIIRALGYSCKAGGGASFGDVDIDLEQMVLCDAEATGSAMKVRGLLPFIRNLWEEEKTVFVKTAKGRWRPTPAVSSAGLERKVIPNPQMSEARLNRFLIKLGRALSASEKRRKLPDWMHMDQTIRFIVHGWCESIIVDDEPWPQLCFLTTPALAKFLALCTPQRWKSEQDPRTLERAITRLGLIRISTGRIKLVARESGKIRFA